MLQKTAFRLFGVTLTGLTCGLGALALQCGGSNSGDQGARSTTSSTGGSGTTTSSSTATGTTTSGTATTTGSTTTTGTTTTGTTTTGSTTGAMCTPAAGMCTAPTDAALLLYDGATTQALCGTSLAMPHNTYWFGYGDATTTATRTQQGDFCGCGGATDCAFHAVGSGYANYGAGVGFDLMDDSAMTAQPYDASSHTGLSFYIRGTTTGTRTTGYAMKDNTVHVKLVQAVDMVGMLERHGDDFGQYCDVTADWTKCDVPFATVKRDGFCKGAQSTGLPCPADPATDMLDLKQLLKIQIEFSAYSVTVDGGQTTPVPVAYDVYLDNVSFY